MPGVALAIGGKGLEAYDSQLKHGEGAVVSVPGACQFRLAIAQLNKIVAHQGIGGVAGRRLRKHCHRVVKLPSLFVSARGTAIKIGAEAGEFLKSLIE